MLINTPTQDSVGISGGAIRERCLSDVIDDETRIPEDIVSVGDLRPYVSGAMNAILNKRPTYCHEGVSGLPNLTDIAANSLEMQGFGHYSARWSTHAFHWFAYNEEGLFSHYSFRNPEKKEGKIITCVFVPDNDKIIGTDPGCITDSFMDRYGNYLFARLERIRNHPRRRPY